jgi:hypothetical protein
MIYRRSRLPIGLDKVDPKAVPGYWISEKSVSFNAVDEYCDIGNQAELAFERTEPFSVSLWVKTVQSATAYMIAKSFATGTVRGWSVRITNGLVYFNLISTVSTSHLQARTTSATVNNGAWRHICITYSGNSSTSGVNFYIDNSLVAKTSTVNTLSSTTLSTASATIGSREGGDSPYGGNIDEPSVWDKELSSGEVSEIYNSGSPALLTLHTAAANLVGYWKMGDDDDVYPTLFDYSVSGNDATMINMSSGNIEEDAP